MNYAYYQIKFSLSVTRITLPNAVKLALKTVGKIPPYFRAFFITGWVPVHRPGPD